MRLDTGEEETAVRLGCNNRTSKFEAANRPPQPYHPLASPHPARPVPLSNNFIASPVSIPPTSNGSVANDNNHFHHPAPYRDAHPSDFYQAHTHFQTNATTNNNSSYSISSSPFSGVPTEPLGSTVSGIAVRSITSVATPPPVLVTVSPLGVVGATRPLGSTPHPHHLPWSPGELHIQATGLKRLEQPGSDVVGGGLVSSSPLIGKPPTGQNGNGTQFCFVNTIETYVDQDGVK
ncbi:unnamed protein product [Protopolystoma xenopodis]|uniref:Uncharacterized protein n=1 Tax=Protopolystoma xenopodis TaxID=117903 RepID=A0A448WYK2_9PLAT|nr:unnamed protein product [Protopolystoma xenopodis]